MLNIYKASAGAGKTYTLTLEYLKLLFQDSKNYKKTLAVTFTNNACGEMKDRILKALYELSFKQDAKYISDLVKANKNWDEETIRTKAKALYKDILHNYSFFFIETIDSFTQRIIRNFAKDLGLPPKFSLELKQDEILETVVKNLLVNSLKNETLHQTIVNFAFDDIDQNKSTDIKKAIIAESKNFFVEQYQEAHRQLSYSPDEEIQRLTQLFNNLENTIKSTQQKISAKAKETIDFVKKAGYALEDFSGGAKSSPLLFLRKYAENDFGNPFKSNALDINKVARKDQIAEVTKLFNSGLQKLLEELNELTAVDSKSWREYRTAEEILKHKQGIILSQFIQNELDTYCKEENTFFIAFANTFLKTIINDCDTPFIYEKIGQFIENIMIDEFQDTSKMQWDNFKPIIANLLALGKDALIIGDVKQSIYRFRNGDWKLLHNLHNDSSFESKIYPLSDNYRSLQNIVSFNNEFFKVYANDVETSFNNSHGVDFGTIREIYADCGQGVKKGDGGCVEIKIVNVEKTPDKKRISVEEQREAILEEIFQKVISLIDGGRKAEDIVFLCYEKKDISRLVEFFNKKKNDAQYIKYKDSLSVMSKEAMLVNNSLAVQFITTYLQKMTVSQDSRDAQFYDSFLEYAYTSLTGNALPTDETDISRNMSLFETIESIIEKFSLHEIPSEIAYITDFQNLVYTYSKNNNTNISHFLEHWDEVKDSTYLQQAQTAGYMSAYTVHTSKGLEYPVVIMPKFTRAKKNSYSVLYKTEYEELPYVNLSGNLEDTTFCDAYVDEMHNIEIDNLNALYVACTRPCEELYIYDYETSTLETLEKIKNKFPEAIFENDTFILGSAKPTTEKKEQAKAKNIEDYPITNIDGEESNAKLLPDKNSKHFIEMLNQPQTEREHGLLMHKILEHISSIENVDSCVNQYCPPELFSQEEKKKISETLKAKLSAERVCHWFDQSWDSILTEQPLLLQGGTEKRPDRMLIKGNEVTIIDYKFTKEKPLSHIQQVREYINILSLMGYTPKGYIWYVDLDEIVDVA